MCKVCVGAILRTGDDCSLEIQMALLLLTLGPSSSSPVSNNYNGSCFHSLHLKAVARPVCLRFHTISASLREGPDREESATQDSAKEVSAALKLAMEKAKTYKTKKNEKEKEKEKEKGDMLLEKKKKNKFTVSSMDFVGLNFADKKNTRALPPGLAQVEDYPVSNPEVEFILGDSTKFGTSTPTSDSNVQNDDPDVYKPKVSTWGVFPRPSNISKTFGGGRVIRPGEELETAKDKAAKELHTRELLAAYKNKISFTIDPVTKSECEKALQEGDYFMDVGKLKQALTYYEKIMDKLVFKSELHGLAALQWSICQDSLNKCDEAKVMYEKLQSHPNPQVRKKAKQLLFCFQATEMLKVRGSSSDRTDYQSYFQAFVQDKREYTLRVEEEEEEGAFSQVFPYILLLVSPIFVVIFIALRKAL